MGESYEKEIFISDEELSSLTLAIKNRYGIDFTNYETKSLKRGFARLIVKKNLGNVLTLWSKILKDRPFFYECIDYLTVNLTELFRNPEIWLQVRDELLPLYANRLRLKMWHAGCSSGEEVYTMAMVLQEKAMLQKSKTLATDLSDTVLELAQKGEYSTMLMTKYKNSFQKYFPKGNFEACFEFQEDCAKVRDKYKSHIVFKKHNLVQDPMNEVFDIVFCRNVMIYFDDTLKMKVLKLFYDSLAPEGFFIIGYYDMLPLQAKDMFKVYDHKTRIYQKNN